MNQPHGGPAIRLVVSSMLVVALAIVVSGCGGPSASNIVLRKQVQTQADEIERLKRQHAADAADATTRANAATKPAALPAPVSSLFTTHGIRLGRLTKADARGLIVHVTPFDDDDDDFKAAGAIAIDAYDLTADGNRVGHWAFDAAQSRPLWNGNALRYEYVVPCPWPSPPAAKTLTVKVTFTDAMTGRSFSANQDVTVVAEE